MIRAINEFFSSRIIYDGAPTESMESRLQLATAALLIEVSRADFDLAEEEREAIVDALQNSFGLTSGQTQELVALAETEVGESISIYEFARLCDKGFTPLQKKHIVGLLWQVAFSDARLDEGEEYLIRKIAKLLHVPHRDFIDEKLRARESKLGSDR